jgi:hypothetical protein
MRRICMILCFTLLTTTAFSQSSASGIFVDKEGTMRWNKDQKEVSLFGVNYSAPFVFGYRHITATGASVEETIKTDVYHLSRMGVTAFRIHVFDTEITDEKGNILENEHLRLFDFLIAELKKRDIKILLTPIAYWGNGYPEKDVPTGSFSFKYGKKEALVNHEAWVAQENYLKQFFTRKNRYTGLTYHQDSDVIATEINNEPQHTGSKEEVTQYVNKMVAAVRGTGWTKPIFYNISESPTYADAVVKANVQGHSFQWYPTGLVANRTQKGNLLPHVSQYNVPFDTIPGFSKRAKIVYEFDGADVYDAYMYPAMARSFRKQGFQWATMFAYDPMPIANVNTEYQTHYLNLAYTPSKAISFLIASKAFNEVNPATKTTSETVFGNTTLDPSAALSVYRTAKEFYYSNSTNTTVINNTKLEKIAGVGSSTVAQYSGTGVYFLDKLADGVWRLELMPDAVTVIDPFNRTSPKKEVTTIVWATHDLVLNLNNLGKNFTLQGINSGNDAQATAVNGRVALQPGTYILKRNGVTTTLKSDANFGVIKLNDFAAPAHKKQSIKVRHEPKSTLSESAEGSIEATVVGVDDADEVWVYFHHLSNKWDKVKMNKVSSYNYQAAIPKTVMMEGILEYHLVIQSVKSCITFPSQFEGTPHDWDFYSKEAYSVTIVSKDAPLNVFNAKADRYELNFYNPDWENYNSSYVLSETQDFVLKSTMEKANGKDFMGWQKYVAPQITARTKDLNSFKTLVVQGKSMREGPVNAKIALITKEGNSYAASLVMDKDTQKVVINLSDLKQEAQLLLPRPFPGFQPMYYHSNTSKAFQLEDVERVEFTFGYNLPNNWINKEVSVQVSNVYLQ